MTLARLFVLPVLILMITAVPSVANSRFDAAKDMLAALGQPFPMGHQLVNKEINGFVAHTNVETQVITVDLDALDTIVGGADGQADVVALAAVLWHEYHHTPDYGCINCSNPLGSPEYICNEIFLNITTTQGWCALAGEVADQGECSDDLCDMINSFNENLNAQAPGNFANNNCEGTPPTEQDCPECNPGGGAGCGVPPE